MTRGGGDKSNALFSAAVLKVSMVRRGLGDKPGFRIVYMGTINDLGVSDEEVNAYIQNHREQIIEHIEQNTSSLEK